MWLILLFIWVNRVPGYGLDFGAGGIVAAIALIVFTLQMVRACLVL